MNSTIGFTDMAQIANNDGCMYFFVFDFYFFFLFPRLFFRFGDFSFSQYFFYRS